MNLDIFLYKLKGYGFRESLIESYLTNSKQCVYANEVSFKVKIVNFGVLKSSVLGPQLFNLSINSNIKPGKTILWR